MRTVSWILGAVGVKHYFGLCGPMVSEKQLA
jgi:sulfite exporter TauE/SafE